MNLSSMVRIRLVLADIFHYLQTRANVAWTNVDSTNVPKNVGNSYRWCNHQIFKVFLSFDKLKWRYEHEGQGLAPRVLFVWNHNLLILSGSPLYKGWHGFLQNQGNLYPKSAKNQPFVQYRDPHKREIEFTIRFITGFIISFNIGFNIGLNFGFHIGFNIWFNIGFNIG